MLGGRAVTVYTSLDPAPALAWYVRLRETLDSNLSSLLSVHL